MKAAIVSAGLAGMAAAAWLFVISGGDSKHREVIAAAQRMQSQWEDYSRKVRPEPPDPVDYTLAMNDLGRALPEIEDSGRVGWLHAKMRVAYPSLRKAFDARLANVQATGSDAAKRDAAHRAENLAARTYALQGDLLAARKKIAVALESDFLRRGRDVHVFAAGDEARTLRIHYPALNRPFIHNIETNIALRREWRNAGFQKVMLSGWSGLPYTFDLQ